MLTSTKEKTTGRPFKKGNERKTLNKSVNTEQKPILNRNQ